MDLNTDLRLSGRALLAQLSYELESWWDEENQTPDPLLARQGALPAELRPRHRGFEPSKLSINLKRVCVDLSYEQVSSFMYSIENLFMHLRYGYLVTTSL